MNVQKVTKAYYYLFYKLYKWIGEENGWADWKAGVAIIALELLLVVIILNYYVVLIDTTISLGSINDVALYVCVAIICIPNYLAFIRTDVWKDYVKKFDALSIKENKKGGRIVFGIITFILVNFLFSFYLYYQV